jgi:hypothetical protein
MTVLEDRIRTVLQLEADAMHVPDARPGERVVGIVQLSERRPPSRTLLVAAAAVLALVVGGVVLIRRAAPPTEPSDAPAPAAFRFETPTVAMDADSFEVIGAGRTWIPSADVEVHSDPGTPNEYTTLELTWPEAGTKQSVFFYFASDGSDWWVSEIRVSDGPRAWIEPTEHGEFFRSPLGTAFVGDLDLPSLRIRGLRLEAFLRPSVCDNPTAPLALLANYPSVREAPQKYGVGFQVLDTATCEYLPVVDYRFELTSANPEIADADPLDEFEVVAPTTVRVGLLLLAPGTTTLRTIATNAAGQVIGSANTQVTVLPAEGSSEDTVATTTP